MKINELKDYLRSIIKSPEHIPLMIWSGPGLGKSSAVRQIADELNMDFIDLRLSLLNPVDLRGLPVIDRTKDSARWLSPEFLPNTKNHKEKGILFLDEINLAPFSVMAAGYQLILDRRLGEYTLPDGWKVIAAGNRAEDNANVTKFPAPLANRFVHIDIEHDEKVWRSWALHSGIAEQILAFLGKFPQHLYKFPKAGERSFPTPRSWELASKLFKLGHRVDSAVGEGVASEFSAFLNVYKELPDVDKILAGKEKTVPKKEKIDVLWALSMALLTRAEPKHIGTIMNYVSGFPKEFEVLTIINLSNKSSQMEAALINSKEWKKWIDENKEIIEENV
jgi:hypothetical protein